MLVGPVIIIFESTFKDRKQDYNKSMRLEAHNLVQISSCLSLIKVIDCEVNNYNQWLHINDVVKDLILMSLAPELFVKLQNFMVALDMLDYPEVGVGE
jgi:hypothetical protein